MINLEMFLPYKLAKLSHQLSEDFRTVYEEKYHLTVPQWRVIAHLAQTSELTAKDICNRANLDKSTVSRAVKQLHTRGILKAHPAVNDKRAVLLSLNAQGIELYKLLAKDALEWQETLLKKISKEEQILLFSIISKLESENV